MYGDRRYRTSILTQGIGAVVFGICLVLGLGGCGGRKGLVAQSPLDTPETHYAQGQKYLEAGDVAAALEEFNRSIALAVGAKRKFAPGYEGKGLALLASKDYKQSREMFEKAKGEDNKYAPAYTGMGRLHDAEKKYDDALGQFKKASEIDPKATDPYFYRGETYTHMEKYDLAEADFQQVLKMEPTHVKANARWEELQRSRRALAGAPPEYTAIAHSKAITRADLAALLVNEIDLKKAFRQAPPSETTSFTPPPGTTGAKDAPAAAPPGEPEDISGHWARSHIDEILAAGLMEKYPDGMFHPDETVTRAAFAQVSQLVLSRALLDEGLSTRYIGQTSPFTDVPASHFAFNAIMVATTRGIMKANLDGSFGLKDTVPGTDAILMIRALKDQLP